MSANDQQAEKQQKNFEGKRGSDLRSLHVKKESTANGPEDLAGSLRLDNVNGSQKGFIQQEPASESSSDEDYMEDQDIMNEVPGLDMSPQKLTPAHFQNTYGGDTKFFQGEGTHRSVGAVIEELDHGKQMKTLAADSGVTEALPLIGAGQSMAADMVFGWRPNPDIVISGAPIPLNYNYEYLTIPVDPSTGKEFIPVYLGARQPNSLEVHRQFGNRAANTDCPQQCKPSKGSTQLNTLEPQSSQAYPFKFPTRAQILKRCESARQFTGMDPNIDYENKYELRFDSHFESGNLDMVLRKSLRPDQVVDNLIPTPVNVTTTTLINKKQRPVEYDLYMRVDTNTRGHHQWFYFSTEFYEGSVFPGQTVKFNVVNFTKKASLYAYGMRVAISRKSNNYAWTKGCENFTYGTSHVKRGCSTKERPVYYSKLSFEYTFDANQSEDKVYFAYCFPYTFSKLQNFLKSVGPKQKEFFKESVLCKSLSGLDVPLITITSRIKQDPNNFNLIKMEEFEDDLSKCSVPFYKRKKYCIIGARVHPGESNSSFMMQGFIKSLLGNSHQAVQLRKRIVFKIIPMVNPDGVIIGNYRTGMCGNDLNRQYHNPNARLHPTVCAIKKMCSLLTYGIENGQKAEDIGGEKISQPEEIMAFIDMHGHSRKKNVFVYGPQVPLHSDKYYKMRIIPKLLSEETAKFRYPSCRFKMEKSKMKTARIVLWREFAIENCFTFEASLHGFFDNHNVNYEFSETSFESMGAHLVNSLYEYMMILEETDRLRKLKEIQKKKHKKNKEKPKPVRQDSKIPDRQSANKNILVEDVDKKKSDSKGLGCGSANGSQTKLGVKKPNIGQRTGSQGAMRTKKLKPPSQFAMDSNSGSYNRQQSSQESSRSSNHQLEMPDNNPNEPHDETPARRSRARQQVNSEDGASSRNNQVGFRNLNDLFKGIKKVDDDLDISEGEGDMEPGTDGDQPEDELQAQLDDVDRDNDELTNDEQARLHNDIINVIKEFGQINNQEFGQTGLLANLRGNNKNSKNKNKKKKEVKGQPTKLESDKKKAESKPKDIPKAQAAAQNSQKAKEVTLPSRKQSQSHTQNYQNYTVSIAQKRRSQQEREELAGQGRRRKQPENLTYYNFSKPPFIQQEQNNPMVVFQDRQSVPAHLQQYLTAPSSQNGNPKGIINFSFQPTAAQGAADPKAPSTSSVQERSAIVQKPQNNNNMSMSHQQQWQLMQQQAQSQRISGQQKDQQTLPGGVTVHHNSNQNNRDFSKGVIVPQRDGQAIQSRNPAVGVNNSVQIQIVGPPGAQQYASSGLNSSSDKMHPTLIQGNAPQAQQLLIKNHQALPWNQQQQLLQQNKFLLTQPAGPAVQYPTNEILNHQAQQVAGGSFFTSQNQQILINNQQHMTSPLDMPFQFKIVAGQGQESASQLNNQSSGSGSQSKNYRDNQVIHVYDTSQNRQVVGGGQSANNASYIQYSGMGSSNIGSNLNSEQIIREASETEARQRQKRAAHVKQHSLSAQKPIINVEKYNTGSESNSPEKQRQGRKTFRENRLDEDQNQEIKQVVAPFKNVSVHHQQHRHHRPRQDSQTQIIAQTTPEPQQVKVGGKNTTAVLLSPGIKQMSQTADKASNQNAFVIVHPTQTPYQDHRANIAAAASANFHQNLSLQKPQHRRGEQHLNSESPDRRHPVNNNKIPIVGQQYQNAPVNQSQVNNQGFLPIPKQASREQIASNKTALSQVSGALPHGILGNRMKPSSASGTQEFDGKRFSAGVKNSSERHRVTSQISGETTLQAPGSVKKQSARTKFDNPPHTASIIQTTGNFDHHGTEHIQSNNPNTTNAISTSLNLVSQQRRQQIGTPKMLAETTIQSNQGQTSASKANTSTTTNLEQLNAFLRNGAANKMRQGVTVNNSIYNGEQELGIDRTSNEGYLTRTGHNLQNKEMFYQSMEQTGYGQTQISGSLQRYQTMNDPQVQKQVTKKASNRISYTESRQQPQNQNISQSGTVFTQTQRKNVTNPLQKSSNQPNKVENVTSSISISDSPGQLGSKPHENNFVVSSQQWQRSDRHLLESIQRKETGSKLLVTDVNSSMVNIDTAQLGLMKQMQSEPECVSPTRTRQALSNQAHHKHLQNIMISQQAATANHPGTSAGAAMIAEYELGTKNKAQSPNRRQIQEQIMVPGSYHTRNGNDVKLEESNSGSSPSNSMNQWQQKPQQSIVHLNQTLEESQKMRGEAELNETPQVSIQMQSEKGLSPEVRGKCFPPGRTTNVFNLQRQKYQFVSRKQPQRTQATASQSNSQMNPTNGEQQSTYGGQASQNSSPTMKNKNQLRNNDPQQVKYQSRITSNAQASSGAAGKQSNSQGMNSASAGGSSGIPGQSQVNYPETVQSPKGKVPPTSSSSYNTYTGANGARQQQALKQQNEQKPTPKR